MWKYLEHPNVISLLGVTITPPQLISNWMSGGDLLQYTKEHPGADRLSLVGVPAIAFTSCLPQF